MNKENLYFETRKKYALLSEMNKLGNKIFRLKCERVKLGQQISVIDNKIIKELNKDGLKFEKELKGGIK